MPSRRAPSSPTATSPSAASSPAAVGTPSAATMRRCRVSFLAHASIGRLLQLYTRCRWQRP
eukprot:1320949-Alexandrium_andersonii.AAC.1